MLLMTTINCLNIGRCWMDPLQTFPGVSTWTKNKVSTKQIEYYSNFNKWNNNNKGNENYMLCVICNLLGARKGFSGTVLLRVVERY